MPTDYRRRTIPATLTLERPTAALDATSVVALEFAQLWAVQQGRLKPATPVVIRRALQLLAGHLSGLTGDPDAIDSGLIRAELVKLEAAGRGSGNARTLTEARARMEEAFDAHRPMGSWLEALHSDGTPAREPRARGLLAQVSKCGTVGGLAK